MSWIIVISGIIIIIYSSGLYLWDKNVTWRPDNRTASRIKYLHYLLAAITIITGLLNIIDDISLRGLWTTRTIIFGLLISGVLIYPLTNWVGKSKLEKYYFRFFSLLPVLTAGLSLIPFWGFVIVASLFGRLIDPVGKVYYDDNNLRVQSTFIGVLGPRRLDVIKNYGLFEKRINKTYKGADADSVSISKLADKTLVLLYIEREVQDTIKIEKIE
jgi:hypothetical protein